MEGAVDSFTLLLGASVTAQSGSFECVIDLMTGCIFGVTLGQLSPWSCTLPYSCTLSGMCSAAAQPGPAGLSPCWLPMLCSCLAMLMDPCSCSCCSTYVVMQSPRLGPPPWLCAHTALAALSQVVWWCQFLRPLQTTSGVPCTVTSAAACCLWQSALLWQLTFFGVGCLCDSRHLKPPVRHPFFGSTLRNCVCCMLPAVVLQELWQKGCVT